MEQLTPETQIATEPTDAQLRAVQLRAADQDAQSRITTMIDKTENGDNFFKDESTAVYDINSTLELDNAPVGMMMFGMANPTMDEMNAAGYNKSERRNMRRLMGMTESDGEFTEGEAATFAMLDASMSSPEVEPIDFEQQTKDIVDEFGYDPTDIYAEEKPDLNEEITDEATTTTEESTAIPTNDEQTSIVDAKEPVVTVKEPVVPTVIADDKAIADTAEKIKSITFEDTKSWTDEQKIAFNKAAGWGDNDSIISETGFKQSMAKFDEYTKEAQTEKPLTFKDTESWTDEQKIELNKAAGWGDNDKTITKQGFKKSMAKFDAMAEEAGKPKPRVRTQQEIDLQNAKDILFSRPPESTWSGDFTTSEENTKKINDFINADSKNNATMTYKNDTYGSPVIDMTNYSSQMINTFKYITSVMGVSINNNSASGGNHASDSTHFYGNGADLNRWDNQKLTSFAVANGTYSDGKTKYKPIPANTPKYKKLYAQMIELSKQDGVNYLLTPIGTFENGVQTRKTIAKAHHNHIHIDTTQDRYRTKAGQDKFDKATKNQLDVTFEDTKKWSKKEEIAWNKKHWGSNRDSKISEVGFSKVQGKATKQQVEDYAKRQKSSK